MGGWVGTYPVFSYLHAEAPATRAMERRIFGG